MILYYGLALFLALALLASLYAQVSQPQTAATLNGRLQIAEARVAAEATQIAYLQPTPRVCARYPSC